MIEEGEAIKSVINKYHNKQKSMFDGGFHVNSVQHIGFVNKPKPRWSITVYDSDIWGYTKAHIYHVMNSGRIKKITYDSDI